MNIVQKFSILSFFWVFFFVIVSGSVLNYNMQRNMMEREGGITSEFVRGRVKEKLTVQDAPRTMLKMNERGYIEMFRDIRMIPEIIGIDVYGPDKTVLWSDREEFIGSKALQNAELQDALSGEDVVDMYVDAGNVHYGRGLEHLLMVYVPITDDLGKVIGVVAAYKVSPVFYESLRRGKVSIWLLSVGGGVLFYISFFGLFYKAYRTQKEMDEGIHRLNKELFDLNSHLENLVDERTLALKKSRDDIQAMFEKMIQMEKLSTLGSLVGEIAHQINNPLVGVVNTAQLALMQAEEGSQLKEDLKGIENAGIECKRIIRKFLDFTRPARFKLSPVDINALLEGSLEVLEKQLRLSNIVVERSYGEKLPPVNVDTTLMTQVFFNIINNAKDAMPDGGRLMISTFLEGEGWLGISFRDTGTGIRDEDMAELFSPFFTTKGEGAGTGLGLSVAANIINSHNGRIYAESKVGEGTAFHIRLPINTD